MALNFYQYTKSADKYGAVVKPEPIKPSEPGLLSNMGRAAGSGALSAVGGIFDFAGADGIAKQFYGWSDDARQSMSKEAQADMAKPFFTESDQGEIQLGDGLTDLDTWLLTMANVAGQFAPTAIPGAGLANTATKALKLGETGTKIATAVGMGATGGASATGQGMEQARQEWKQMPDELKLQSDLFKNTIREMKQKQPDLDGEALWTAAEDNVAERLASEVQTDPKVLMANFAGSAVADPIIGRALTGARLAKSGAFRSAAKGFAIEGSTEAGQAAVQEYGINQALSQVDGRNPMDGVAIAALNEGVAGGTLGAAAGGVGGLLNRKQAEPVKDPEADAIRDKNPDLASAFDGMAQSAAQREADLQSIIGGMPAISQPALEGELLDPEQAAGPNYNPNQIGMQARIGGPTVPRITQKDVIFAADGRTEAERNPAMEGEWLSPEQRAANAAAGFIENAPIDLESEQVKQAKAEMERMRNQPRQIADKNIIFAGDGRPQQATQEFTDNLQRQANEAASVPRLPQKDIIFAGDQSGVRVKGNGQVYLSPREAMTSKQARAMKRSGTPVEAVPFGDGWGWRVKESQPEQAQQPDIQPEQMVQPVEPAPIQLMKSGRPFSTEAMMLKSASYKEAAATGAELEPVKVEGGFGFRVKAQSVSDPAPQDAPEVQTRPAIDGRPTGKASVATTPAGRDIDVEYQVVEADSLITSNLEDGRSNPDFPPELQPRDRSRAASMDQINRIAGAVNPRLLAESPTTSDGAPIISADGIVESGNGRSLGIRKAYRQGGAEGYRQWLSENGYNVDGMKQPVLVRVRRTELSPEDRLAYIKESNQRTTLEMSATEQAASDAAKMSGVVADYMGGEITSAENRSFVRKFMQNVAGEAERGGLMDSSGVLSQNGRRRIEAALLSAAYGDDGIVAEVFESGDTDIKAIGGALLDAAGKWAQMRNAGRDGMIADGMDVTPFLLEAVNLIRRARGEGKALIELVSTDDIFSGSLPDETRAWLSIFYRGDTLSRARGRDKVAQALSDYADEALKTQPGDGLFGDVVTSDQVMGAVNERIKNQEGSGAQQSGLFTAGNADATESRAEGGQERQGSSAERANGPDREQPEKPAVTAEPNTQTPADAGVSVSEPAERIDDFGEKLGGARKDVWAGFSEAVSGDLDTRELPLSKSFPEPDYVKMAADGVSMETLAIIAAMRSEIPAKPRVSYKVRRWAEKVDVLRNFARDLIGGELTPAQVIAAMSKSGGELQAIADAIPAIAQSNPETIKLAAKYRLGSGSFSMFRGQEYRPSKTFYYPQNGGTEILDLASPDKQGALDNLVKLIKAEAAANPDTAGQKQSKISIYSDRYTKQVYLGWAGGSGVLRIQNFDTVNEAREYLKSNRADVEAKLKQLKQVPEMRRPENRKRVGPPRFAGSITPAIFADTFGFRGVEFGNWVEQGKRQKDLNEAYDALMDLADVLGVPPKALALNGELGMAFGARGKGAATTIKAAAHYEPSYVAINLTKESGSGSLAHEWWHAVDNYFARLSGNPNSFVTEGGNIRGGDLRQEVRDAFTALILSIRKTKMFQRASTLDSRRSKAYWSSEIEASARSFETFIIAELEAKGFSNDYLANVVDPDVWGAIESAEQTYPYPTKAEQEIINPAFRSFFDTLQTKETDKGVMLFSKQNTINSKPARGVNAKLAKQMVANMMKRLNGAAGIKVVVLETQAEAEKLWQMSLSGDLVRGAYNRATNTAYVIAENVKSLDELREVVAHEVIGHGGLQNVISKEDYTAFIERLKQTRNNRAFADQWAQIDDDYEGFSENDKAEELFAYFVQNKPVTGPVKMWWNAMKRFLHKALVSVGLAKAGDPDVEAMQDMLESIRAGFMFSRGGAVNGADSELAFSKTRTTEELASKVSDLVGRKRLDPDDPYAVENRRLKEQDRTLWDKAKQIFMRNFAPGGLLPRSIFEAKITRDGELESGEMTIKHLIFTLERAVQKDTGQKVDSQSDEFIQMMADALAGKVSEKLGSETKAALVAMRQYIDALSGDYLSVIQGKINALTEQIKQDDKYTDKVKALNEIELYEKIKGNMGVYVNRSYRAFDDPEWFQKVPVEVINRAREYLRGQYKAQGDDQAEANRKAEVTLNKILKTDTAYDSMGAFIAESKLGAKDLSTLIARKDISPEIRELLGEYKDPRMNFAKTATKMARLVWNSRFLDKVKADGVGVIFFDEDSRPAEATVQIAGDQSKTYEPLNGYWTYPEVAEALQDSLGTEKMEAWYEAAVKFTSIVKYGKTVLSPTTAMRNWQSAMFFAVANGHFDFSHMKKSLAAFREQVSQSATGDDLAYLKKLKKLGVVYDAPYAGEMMRLLADSKIDEWLEGKKGNVFGTARQINNLAQGFYSFGDDFWKIIGYENEKANFIKAGLSEPEAEKMAAERIRNTYPTYSMVGRAIKKLARFPLMGTFVSFPAEIIRTTANMLRYSAQDMKSDNPAIRAMARKRLTGMALVSGMFYALSAMTAAMLGVDDEEEEAIRDVGPSWQKNSTFLFYGRDDKGKLQYFDISFLDPYGYFKRPITAMLRDQPWEDAAASGAADMLSPFFGADITAGTFFQVFANKKQSGAQVYNEYADGTDQLVSIADHIWTGLRPGFVNNAMGIFNSVAGNRREGSGKEYDLGDEMMALMGWRASSLDAPTALYYRSFDFADQLQAANATLNKVLRSDNDVDETDIADAKEEAQRQYDDAFKQMQRIVQSGRNAGMTKEQVYRTLKLSGVSSRNISGLVNGNIPPMQAATLQTQVKAVAKAREIRGDDQASEVLRRFQIARQLP